MYGCKRFAPQLSPDGHGVCGKLRLLAVAEEPFAGQAPKGGPEVDAVEGVYEWIDGAIEPAEPCERLGKHAAHLMLFQERRNEVIDKKWQPAGNKATDNNAQCLRRLVLLFQRCNAI